MFCKYCGAKVADGVKFCPACGKPTGVSSTPTSQQAPRAEHTSARPAHNINIPKVPKAPKASGHTARPAVKYKKKLNIGNYALWVGCAIAIASLFMNFASASISVLGYSQSKSVKLMDAEDGMIFMVIIIAVAVINLLKLNILSIIGSGFTIFLVFMEVQNAEDSLGGFGSMVEYGPGRSLLILGSVIMLIAAIAAFVLNINAKKNAQ